MEATAALPEIKFLDTRMSRWDDLVAMAGESGVRITPETAIKTAAYFACARVVAETVASLPLHLYRRLDDHNSERAKDLPLYNVLARRPNSWQTRYEWVEQMCLHLGFYGNSYQFKVAGDRGSVSELHPLNPAGMKVVQESDKSLSYVYTDPSTGRQQAYRDDQIMHVRWLSFDGVHGEVPVELGKDAIGLARALEQYAAAFYRNNAQPGIILHTDQALPREVREQLRDQWEAAHRGPAKAGKTAILSNGLKADSVAATNQESQLAELWMQSLLAICRVWRMPPHMIQELGRATWGNLQSEMVSFEKFTIGPWLRRIEGAIERDVLPEDGDLYAEFLVEGLLRGDITTRYAAYEVAIKNGWMTPEEVRQKENMGPMPEVDDASPGETEDTTGDATEDVTEGEGSASETNQSGTMTTDQPSGRSLPQVRFSEDQPRDETGKWTSGGGSSGGGDSGGGDVGGDGAGAADAKGSRGNASPEVKAWAERKFSDPEHAKAFAEWFGDSKVVDEKGEPLTVYHGTTAGFDQFEPSAKGMLGPGIYASADKGDYGEYSPYSQKDNAQVMPLYMSIRNPHYAIAGDFKTFDAPAGHDGTILLDKRTRKVLWAVARNPADVKSATGNSGTFNPSDPNIKRHAAASTETVDE